jgi:hypothetical protein
MNISEAVVKVYDALGNELFVLNENRQFRAKKQHHLGNWKLQAKTGKVVFEGTYMVILKITTSDNENYAVRKMIGIINK